MKTYTREWLNKNGIKTVADIKANLVLFSLEADYYEFLNEDCMETGDYDDDTPVLAVNISSVSHTAEIIVDTSGGDADNGFSAAFLL